MTPSLALAPDQRQALLDRYRTDPDPEVRFRAHILLLLAAGRPWADIQAILFCSSRTIDRWLKRFQQEGAEGLAGKKRGRPLRFGVGRIAIITTWVTRHSPRDFGFLRSRRACATLALLLRERHDLAVSRETVRRWLHRADLVYRRPRPVVGPTDPDREAVLEALRAYLAGRPGGETWVFQDEAEVHTNPKIGRMWMPRGEQATVTTPGTNRKRYLSGSIHGRTGAVILTEGAEKQGRDTALFLRHLDDLRRRLRRYRKIHVICDNASCHTSAEALQYLARWQHRIEVHVLPCYAPETNPIERIWWQLHEHVTRNHRCKDLEELLELAFGWLKERNPLPVEDSEFWGPKAA